MIDGKRRMDRIRDEVCERIREGSDGILPIQVKGIRPNLNGGYPVSTEAYIDLNVQAMYNQWDPKGTTVELAEVFLSGFYELEHGSCDIDGYFEGLWWWPIFEAARENERRWVDNRLTGDAPGEVEVAASIHREVMERDLLKAVARPVVDFIIMYWSLKEHKDDE